MHSMPRRTFLSNVLALSALGSALDLSAEEVPVQHGVLVAADQDRFAHRRKVFGSLPIDVKVAGADTGGALFVIEQIDDRKGGPPRHVHLSQDEWFHVVDGAYVVEVGDERFSLGAGDSLLAPRGVPHVWAHVGEGTGRMLIGFLPAGEMEDFFAQATQLESVPQGPAAARLFAEHGMQLLGPPLATG
jgi:quercetin dioxygenase-like cupin family protein